MSYSIEEITNKILKEYQNKTTYELCDWFNGEYILTLKSVREHILEQFTIHYPTIPIEKVELYLKNRINTKYYSQITPILDKLKTTPQLIQRSPEWHAFRENLITGSEAAYFLGISGMSNAVNSFKGKIGLPCTRPNNEAPAIQHGVNYEAVAKRLYELRYNVEIMELGCVVSPSKFIGASPDGIVIKTHGKTWESWSRYGRMLEIKCPYSRIIDDNVKPEYEVQMLQQQYTCHLPICDFLECGILDASHGKGVSGVIAYKNLDELLADSYDIHAQEMKTKIHNKNIPLTNLRFNGLEKGIAIMAYYNGNNSNNGKILQNETLIYPIEKEYKKDEINKWIWETQKELDKRGFSGYNTKYWKIYNFSIKTRIYNQELYEKTYIPKLESTWNHICKLRNITNPDEKMKIIGGWINIYDLHNISYVTNLKEEKYINISACYENMTENINMNTSTNTSINKTKKSKNMMNNLMESEMIDNLLNEYYNTHSYID